MANNYPEKQKQAFSVAVATPTYQSLIRRTLSDPDRANRFVAAITSAVAVNPALQECTAPSILAGALLGESLNLQPSPQLGQFYLVPYKNTKEGCTEAQFQLGYKGYIQLALRSGYYKSLNVIEVKKGELKGFDPFNESYEFNYISDPMTRESAQTVGYYAAFEYLNGFRKAMYWSKEKMEAHALRYSKGYAAKKGYTFWEKDFDAMARKTMLRQLISHWGVMTSELAFAFAHDEEVVSVDANGNFSQDTATPPPAMTPPAAETPETSEPEAISFDDI